MMHPVHDNIDNDHGHPQGNGSHKIPVEEFVFVFGRFGHITVFSEKDHKSIPGHPAA